MTRTEAAPYKSADPELELVESFGEIRASALARLGELRRVLAEHVATAVGSAVSGLWHVRPTVEALEVNRLAVGRGARIAAVTAVVAGTAAAGAPLSLLRERSGSLAGVAAPGHQLRGSAGQHPGPPAGPDALAPKPG